MSTNVALAATRVCRCGGSPVQLSSAPCMSSEVPMRMFRWMVLVAATVLPAAAATAQRYDPKYPVCMHVWKVDGDYIDCSFTSWDQCRATASGRSAMCLDNPYWPRTRQASPVDRR